MAVVSPGFDALIGQPQAVEILTQAIAKQRIAPAYLFAGPDGVGRGLAARQFLELILSSTSSPQRRASFQNHPDLLWIEPTYTVQGKLVTLSELQAKGEPPPKSRPQIRLEQVREISRFVSRAPLEALRSLVVLEQAETMNEAAANGLLKTLEEPGQATLILIAPSERSLLPTLVSRCQRVPFYRLPPAELAQVIQPTPYAELLNHPLILQMAQGSPGAAINHWQKLQTLPAEVLQACNPLPSSPRAALELARQISQTLDLESQLWLVDYLQHLCWQQAGGGGHNGQAGRSHGWLQVLHRLEQARQHLLNYAQPQLVWEVTLLDC